MVWPAQAALDIECVEPGVPPEDSHSPEVHPVGWGTFQSEVGWML